MNGCCAKGAQKETDQNELWMKFLFDEDSEDEGTTSKKGTSTRIGLEKSSEKRKGEPSPTSSTYVHNSIDTENPLQPRYFAPTRTRAIRQNSQVGDNGAVDDEIDQSSGFSTYNRQFEENHNPPMPFARARNPPYMEKQYQLNRDLSTEK
ncbi:hypothetical protein EYC84_010936 [Monilinia fructicola]|uniref:Uncharacterized protein n=1 Tax=Monilinia fructicola TaxID=38448 RepID=A0A5M9J9G9_MONFR|nr:hypothetical protein EYC84_010936 [Monilinia fructicola]